MEMPDHAWISSLPTGVQFAINAAIGLATFAGGLWAYLTQVRKAKSAVTPSPPSEDVVVPMLQIADMSPFRELAKQVARMADAQEAVYREHKLLREMFGEWMNEEEIERRVRQRISQG